MTIRFAAVAMALAVAAGNLGCIDGLRGVPMTAPAVTGKIVTQVSTRELGGLVVFWNGPTGRAYETAVWGAWIAGSQEELEAVWKSAAKGSTPRVDFAKYVVFAFAFEDNTAP